MKSLLLLVLLWNGVAQAARSNDELNCFYRAYSDQQGYSDVILTFWQDASYRPLGGRIQIRYDYGGSVQRDIRGSDIAFLAYSTTEGAEMGANVHVRSQDIDLVLNYFGNDFSNDAANWLRVRNPSLNDMVYAYREMLEQDAIHHRTRAGTTATSQLSGTVNDYGQYRKLASTLIVCTY
ncbi:MAG: hypothetical protein AB7F86_11920 [Bdellovibrionales bacterium]